MIRVFKLLLRARPFILLPVMLLASICWLGALVIFVYWSVFGSGWTIRLFSLAGAILLIFITAVVPGRRPLTLLSIVLKLRSSLPANLRSPRLPSLGDPVMVSFDRHGVPSIKARSPGDAFRVLGYLNARDRLFQMDLLRKQAAGRWAELFGPVALRLDIASRELGFTRLAEKLVAELPAGQQAVLLAYTEGVNTFMTEKRSRPFEFRVLHYYPEPWEPKDSMLVMLQMFRLLSGDQTTKRTLTVMDHVLPPEVVAFLTPDFDAYSEVLLGNRMSSRAEETIPVSALATLYRQSYERKERPKGFVQTSDSHGGSNCWAVDGSRSPNGHAVLANDIHLELGVPNLWYRAAICYEGMELSGVMIPGIAAILVGSNAHIAWGIASIPGDCLDLVRLELNPVNPAEYKTPTGWQEMQVEEEVIKIKGGASYPIVVAHTIWGPLCTDLLLGEPVALRWSVFDSAGVNLDIINMDRATGVEDAVNIMQHWTAPPLNMLLVDDTGRIAYTVCGRFPVRYGFDGGTAQSWANGEKGWNGYVPPGKLPCVIDPLDGQLAVANNRIFGNDYPLTIGRNFSNGYRAHRISSQLRKRKSIDEMDMFNLQLDSTSEFYEFYRELALNVLTDEEELQAVITSWDGKASVDSRAFALLVAFREGLAVAILEPLLETCKTADPQFIYSWHNYETPLRLLLTQKIPETLPYPGLYPDWDSFILDRLITTAQELKNKYRVNRLDKLAWGRVNQAGILHPFASALPQLRKLLNMPNDPLAGCAQSICVSAPRFGATLRMVVSPKAKSEGILQMPCGQSGHPLSSHYDDQHRDWIKQTPSEFPPGPQTSVVIFSPETESHADRKKRPRPARLPPNHS